MSELLFAKRLIIYSKKYHSTAFDMKELSRLLFNFATDGAIRNDSNFKTNMANEIKSIT